MSTAAAAPLSGVRAESRFYLWMSVIYVLIAFGGFARTYWVPVVGGRFGGGVVLHIHGLLLFSWTVFFFAQNVLVAARRVPDHRAWGLAGISLFSVMMCSILLAQYIIMRRDAAAGYESAALRFSAITLLAWPFMATLFTLAIVNIRKPESHKRWMTLLMINMMTPAIARVVLAVITALSPPGALDGPPPPFVVAPPAYIGALLLLFAVIHDKRTRGRVHPVYAYGAIPTLLYPIAAILLSRTDAWLAFARGYEHLAG